MLKFTAGQTAPCRAGGQRIPGAVVQEKPAAVAAPTPRDRVRAVRELLLVG
jgi:negative regulator of replication initiation